MCVCLYFESMWVMGGSVPFHKSLHRIRVISGKYRGDVYCLRSGALERKTFGCWLHIFQVQNLKQLTEPV